MNVLIELANNGINITEIITAIYIDEGFAKRLGKTSSGGCNSHPLTIR